MTYIALHNPIASSDKLERIHLFAGRHLGEEEFDRQQAYADSRLAHLLKNHQPGVVYGLNLISAGDNLAASETFVVNPGLAVTPQGQTLNLQRPLKVDWLALIDQYLSLTAISDATGIYYLTLHQDLNTIDSPSVEPCQRAEFDPTRDSRLVTVTSVGLKRLAIAPTLIATTPPAQLQNWIVADRVTAEFLHNFQQSVPLALVAITTTGSDHTVNWVSIAGGRYETSNRPGYQVLLQQTSETIRSVMLAHSQPANSATDLEEFLNNNLHLDYLPAAGQLPISWLQNPDSVTPGLLWLPEHLGIDMLPVPADSVSELIDRHLPRKVIDLRTPAADKIRLLLALDSRDYRPDLLDIPPTDSKLESDIYRFYMRAYDSWLHWREQFDLLYYLKPSNEEPLTTPVDLVEIEHAVLDPKQFKELGLPKPTLPPITPVTLFTRVRERALQELQESSTAPVPYPYDQATPAEPDFYTDWLVNIDGSDVPPPVPVPEEDGLVVQYAVAMIDLEAIENQIRAIRTRLEKTRDLLLLQRQQLDSQTVSLSSLAGGVAGDGYGMQVARWLPYASLNTDQIPEELQAASSSSSASSATAKSVDSGITTKASLGDVSAFGSKSFSTNLLSAALNTSTSSTLSYLSSKPQTYSAFELEVNKKRLDLLANLGKSSMSKPAYEAKQFRFGVLDHISPEINEYTKAYYGMKDLITTINDLFDPTDAASLRNKLKATEKDIGLVDLNTLESQIDARTKELAGDDTSKYQELRGLVANQKRYEALFNAGKVLTKWISIVESRYNQVERKLQGKLREHSRKLAQIEKLSGLIRVARETLENLDRRFDELRGDYGVAQRLLEEDWRQVYSANQERSRILTTALQGLYYVRVRNTPVSIPLADPLALRHKSHTDIVPGCDSMAEAQLPAELDSFFEAVTEIPMDDWSALRPYGVKLPPFEKYGYFGKLRTTRFQARPSRLTIGSGKDTLQARLNSVYLQNQTVMKQWSSLAFPVFTASSKRTQKQAAKVFSLADLVTGGSSFLRKKAQSLQEKLEQCQACLLENLALLPGSIRLQWGQLAEDDRIRVERVSWWPALDLAEQDDFNATRTIAELIDWWFRQLSEEAEAPSRNAMRNMVRAALIFASLGDPQEIVRGTVFVPPRRVRPGELFRVKLNRAIQPGSSLQLLDINQQVAAELSVEDHSPDSTQVRIVNLVQQDIAINSRLAVVGNLRRS
ncbi:MAG: hypothetical protein QNJ17_00530 [Desulfocapsaceae bacterium]|nr:hypothetical protein [Desulfocapsaceae bacterium]